MPVRDYPAVRPCEVTSECSAEQTPLQCLVAMLGGTFFADMVTGSNMYAEKQGLYRTDLYVDYRCKESGPAM